MKTRKFFTNQINIVLLAVLCSFLLGGMLLILIGIITGGHLNNLTIMSLLLLVYMWLLSAAAFTLWTYLLKYNKVSKITVFNFLVPVFGAILSSVLLRESFLNIKNITALLLVSLGVYIVNRNKR